MVYGLLDKQRCYCKKIHWIVLTRLDYGDAVLVGIPGYQQQQMPAVLNARARLIFIYREYNHVSKLLIHLHCFRSPERITFKIAVITYECLHNMAPYYLSHELKRVSGIPSHSLQQHLSFREHVSPLSETLHFLLLTPRYETVSRPTLPVPSLSTFKNRLTTGLFRLSYRSTLQ